MRTTRWYEHTLQQMETTVTRLLLLLGSEMLTAGNYGVVTRFLIILYGVRKQRSCPTWLYSYGGSNAHLPMRTVIISKFKWGVLLYYVSSDFSAFNCSPLLPTTGYSPATPQTRVWEQPPLWHIWSMFKAFIVYVPAALLLGQKLVPFYFYVIRQTRKVSFSLFIKCLAAWASPLSMLFVPRNVMYILKPIMVKSWSITSLL